MIFVWQFWESILILASVATIISLGLFISMSSGPLSVAHAALAGIGAYVAGYLTSTETTNLWVALVAAVLIATVFGAVLGFLTIPLHPLVAGLMSLAFAQVLVVIVLNTEKIGGASGLSGIPIDTTLSVALAGVAVAFILTILSDRSRLSMQARACRDDIDAARANGVRVVAVRTLTFALGAGMAGFGGALKVHYVSVIVPDDLGFAAGVNVLLFVIFGGSYAVWGPVVGTVVLTVLPEALRFTSADRYILYGLLLAVATVLRSSGMISRRMPRLVSKGSTLRWSRLYPPKSPWRRRTPEGADV